MGFTYKQLRGIQKGFMQRYFLAEPYDQYVNACGISTLGIIQETPGKKMDLGIGESLDDLCLDVMFRKEPPVDLEFPSSYEGVRVFYKTIGEIRLLDEGFYRNTSN
jgi:hypothetical protein